MGKLRVVLHVSVLFFCMLKKNRSTFCLESWVGKVGNTLGALILETLKRREGIFGWKILKIHGQLAV